MSTEPQIIGLPMAHWLHQRITDPRCAYVQIARVALLCVVIALLLGLFRLSVNGDPSHLISSNSARFQAYASIVSAFPGEKNQVNIYTIAHAFDPEHITAYESVIGALEELPGVSGVISLYSSSSLGNALDKIAQNPTEANASGLLTGVRTLLSQPDYLLSRFVSADFDALLMSVTLSEGVEPTSTLARINAVLASKYPAESGIAFSMAGTPVVEQLISQDTLAELLRVTGIALAFSIAVAWWIYRDLIFVAKVMSVPILALLCTLGFMGWLGITLNLLTQSVLVVVFLVVCTDTLHSVHGRRSQKSLLLACALTSITTATAAFALLFASSNVMQEFGIALLSGVTIGFMVWALCLFSGIFNYFRLNNSRAELSWPVQKKTSRQRFWLTLLTAFTILVVPASQLRTGFSLLENFPKSHGSMVALNLAENQFYGSSPLQVIVTGPHEKLSNEEFLKRLRALQHRLNAISVEDSSSEGIHWYSVLDVMALTPGFSQRQRLRALPHEVRRSLWNSGPSAVMFAPVPVLDVVRSSADFLTVLDERISQAAIDEGLKTSVVTGLPTLMREASQHILPDAIRTVSIALMALAVVICVVLKSLRLVFIAAVPVVFGVLGFATTLVLIDEPLRHAGVVMLTLVIGLSIDNSLHLIVAAKNHEYQVSSALARCMPILWAATMVIMAGFIALTFSQIPSISSLGIATAVALAISFTASALWLPDSL